MIAMLSRSATNSVDASDECSGPGKMSPAMATNNTVAAKVEQVVVTWLLASFSPIAPFAPSAPAVLASFVSNATPTVRPFRTLYPARH
jgi:hypothetical protein